MIQQFIVANTFTHQIDCFCPGEEHVDFLTLKDGDVIEVTNDRKFTIGNGWYFLIVINNQCPIYISIYDLEQYYSNEEFLSILDIELKINYLQFQINHTLDTENEESFLNYTTELNKLNNLKEKFNTFLSREESPFFN